MPKESHNTVWIRGLGSLTFHTLPRPAERFGKFLVSATLFAGFFHKLRNSGFRNFYLNIVIHSDGHNIVLHVKYRAMDTTGSNDIVIFFNAFEHFIMSELGFPLRTDYDEIKNYKNQYYRKKTYQRVLLRGQSHGLRFLGYR